MALKQKEAQDGFCVLYPPEALSTLKEVNDAPITIFPLYVVPVTDRLSLKPTPHNGMLANAIDVAYGRVFLPEALVPEDRRDQYEKVLAISDGMRSCTLVPDRTLSSGLTPSETSRRIPIANPIQLSAVGVKGDDAELVELPSIGIKGVGTVFKGLSPDDEAVYSLVDDRRGATPRLQKFINHFAPLSPIIVPRRLQDEPTDSRAIGGHLAIDVERNITVTDQMLEREMNLKFFPTICGGIIPRWALKEMMRHSQEAGVVRNFGRRFLEPLYPGVHLPETQFLLAQSIRLSFSQIRARGFTQEFFDISDATLRFKALGFNPEEYRERIAPIYRRDFRRVFDVATKFYQTDISGVYRHFDFAEMQYIEEMSERQFRNYTDAYYFTKDLALAATGVYLADLDAVELDNRRNQSNILLYTRRFTAELLKEWLRLMTNLRIASYAVEGKHVSQDAYREIEREEYQLLLSELQNSTTSNVRDNGTSLLVSTRIFDENGQPTDVGYQAIVEKSLLHMQYQS